MSAAVRALPLILRGDCERMQRFGRAVLQCNLISSVCILRFGVVCLVAVSVSVDVDSMRTELYNCLFYSCS